MRVETQSPAASIEALLRAGVRLLEHTSASPRLDAELLLAHVVGCERAQLFITRSDRLSGEITERFLALVAERRRHRPVAQIIGIREFWSLTLTVTDQVLTPRPETELLVEQALARLPPRTAMRVLDLGTGSGAVALAIASERPDCIVTATDASPAALEVAQRNAATSGMTTLRFALGDWFQAARGEFFDVIVSNPPYIADHEWPGTDAELAFEPRLALAGGADGLDALRIIATGAPTHLVRGGWLLLEHGASQGAAVRELLSLAGFTAIGTISDLAGLPRVSCGRLPD